jgi:hypothetical protein
MSVISPEVRDFTTTETVNRRLNEGDCHVHTRRRENLKSEVASMFVITLNKLSSTAKHF